MSALSAARNTPMMGGEGTFKHTLPVKGSTTIYQGGLVMVDNTGYAKPGASGATTNVSFGIALSTVANSGSDGALSVDTITELAVLLDTSGASQATVGLPVYFTDDHTVTTTSTGNSKVGVCIGYVSASSIWVYIGVPR